MPEQISAEILVVGAGPAGLAAAVRAAEFGRDVVVVDDNPDAGGQIWRAARGGKNAEARQWIDRLDASRVRFMPGLQVVGQAAAKQLVGESAQGVVSLGFDKLILATGARERFLPLPGWTLPGVFGAGGLQALVKGGLPIEGKRVVVAGSGPLLLAVAAHLVERGAEVVCVAEQAGRGQLARFAFSLAFGQWGKLRQAFALRKQLRGMPLLPGCWPVRIEGNGRVESVTLTDGRRQTTHTADYVACGFGLIPNLELAALLGCELAGRRVQIDEFQRTSVADVYTAGETTGIGGLELSLVEGQIAGLAAAGQPQIAELLFAERARARRFAARLERTFALREELKQLVHDDTLVCRCEDVPYNAIKAYNNWRDAKLQTRCGMGPCQGRICGGATEFLLGWPAESIRPPVLPCRLETLAEIK